MISKTYPYGGARAVHYSYDLRGLQLSARFDSQAGEGVANVYDGFGRLASSSTNMDGVTRTLSYAYDSASNRTRVTHPDGVYFVSEYDALGRQTCIHELDPTSTSGMVYPIHADHGALHALGLRNGVVTNFGYDGATRLNAILHYLAAPTGNVMWIFGRNPAGQVASQWLSNDAFVWTGHYPVERAYATNGLNQYSAAGPASFTYDGNGNLSSDGSRSYVYDVENRLTSASPNVALRYDPLGRLYEVSGASGTTRFLYDGDALVAEYDAAGAMLRRYLHNAGTDVPAVWYEGAGLTDRRFLHADHQGSIVARTGATASVAAINAYDEYGIPAAGNSGRFQYTGQIWLPELGMYHYKARVYSPTLGRMMQTDPVGYDDQFNLYAYVGNDPVNGTDPDGKQSVFESAADWVANSAVMVANDLGDLGGAILRGDFQYAFGGMPPTLGGGAGGALSSLGRTAARAEVSVAGQAAGRAREVHKVLDPVAQTRRTTAVLESSRGRIVAGGGRDLTAAQRGALRPGETAARAPGRHAEVTALGQGASSGARPLAMGTSRPICPSCADAIRASGGQVTSPTTAVWQRPFWRFWER